MAELLETALADWHRGRGARMVPFAGWMMPVQYTSIIEEHRAVRETVGMFDISHMGRLSITGADAERLVDRIFSNDPLGMKPGQVRYGFLLNHQGGILDDVLLTRWSATRMTMVVNAANRCRILDWIAENRGDLTVTVQDDTFVTGMIAVQGPAAMASLQPLFPAVPLAAIRYYFAVETHYQGEPTVLSRTGYTGEDGFELTVPAAVVPSLAETLYQSGVRPCGLGARDTLRLEAGMPLYGHELTEETDPISAGLGWAVKLAKGVFIGREAIEALIARTPGIAPRPVRVGLLLEGRGAAREGSPVRRGNETIGTVTSGSFAPWLQRSIAMARVAPTAAGLGTRLDVDLRGTMVPATVVDLPFYQRGDPSG